MARDTIKQGIELSATDKASRVLSNLQKNLDKSAKAMVGLKMASDAVMKIANRVSELTSVGANFEEQMAEVQMVTRLSNTEMKNVGDEARKLSKIFGVDAAAGVETFGGFVAQLGTAIANDQAALASLGNSAFTLSKSMKNDVTGAMNALSTSLIQFKVNLNDGTKAASEAARMMNVLAAGGNAGKAEVADLAASFAEAGAIFQMSNVSFEEATGVLETLSLTMGQTGAEAGTSMRNILLAMSNIDISSKRALGRLQNLGVNMNIVKNKSLPLVDRLEELRKILKDDAAMTLLFDRANVGAAKNIIENTDLLRDLTKQVTGTDDAIQNANIRMNTSTEKMKRHKAAIDDLKIGFFELMGDAAPWFSIISEGGGEVLSYAADIGMITFALKGVGGAALAAAGAVSSLLAGIGLAVYAWNTIPDFRAMFKTDWEELKWYWEELTGRGVNRRSAQFASAIQDIGKGNIGKAWNTAMSGLDPFINRWSTAQERRDKNELEIGKKMYGPDYKTFTPVSMAPLGFTPLSPAGAAHIEYKPTINVNGSNLSERDIKKAVDDSYEQFRKFQERWLKDNERLSYSSNF